jgi:hypothetical protein
MRMNRAEIIRRAERKRQIERLWKKAERMERWLQENRPKMGKQGREIKSNVTENV